MGHILDIHKWSEIPISGEAIESIHRILRRRKIFITFINRNNAPYNAENDDNYNDSIYHLDKDDMATDDYYASVDGGSILGVENKGGINEDDGKSNYNTANCGDNGDTNDSETEGNDDGQVANKHHNYGVGNDIR